MVYLRRTDSIIGGVTSVGFTHTKQQSPNDTKTGFEIVELGPEKSYRFPIKSFSRNICALVKKPELSQADNKDTSPGGKSISP